MSNTEVFLKGIAAAPGIAIGNAYFYSKDTYAFCTDSIVSSDIDHQIERFMKGREKTKSQLEQIYEKSCADLGEELAEVFAGHIEILMDEELEESVTGIIKNDKVVAEEAIRRAIDEIADVIEQNENQYMKERAVDIRDIGKRLRYATANIELPSMNGLGENTILFSNELTPSDTAQIDKSKVVGIVTETGGETSHVAILARSLEIPAIVGVGKFKDKIRNDDKVIIDANSGTVLFDPGEKTIAQYHEKINIYNDEKKEIAKLKDLPAVTTDGKKIELFGNIGCEADVKSALSNGAEGIGLFRTEFLYMDKKHMPSEAEQFTAYRVVAEAMKDKPVIIRTMDIGGDKELCYLPVPKEQNPFLGWRAIRMCLDMPEIIQTQLRAILRASHYGKIKIMYPMIISIEEIRALNAILETEKKGLTEKKIPFDENIEVGIMIETPAAAIIASDLVREVDFFSIGTNDLTQYTLAVDRCNEKIAHLYQPLHPSVIRLIKNIIDVSHVHGKWTGICGELGGNEKAVLILVGMGIDELSMSPVSIGRIKKIIRKSSYAELKKIAEQALSLSETSAVIRLLDNSLQRILES
jgi:phosphoenolpyruvate-protein phosphotransferase (PTS system enzyme I)